MTSLPPPERAPARRSTAHRWLLVIPFVWQVALVPVVNDVRATPLEIPFPMLWQMLGIVATSVVIATVVRLDRAAGVDDEERRFEEATETTAGGPA
ncbi:DUF3311 domain-containing protein [Microbispora sp. ATCC PTA-5024]|uniref:DUF3311 domain-containing protein n=1 Tax=Microbispora sp. ATCC PTA-5024 TaxID=316330 RepID=UPI000428D8B8|nr:DUF3311 domain-containing protein [Microbispora sp. ATCC PTA-5024]